MTPSPHPTAAGRRTVLAVGGGIVALATALATLAACDSDQPDAAGSTTTVTVLTNDSFAVDEATLAEFERTSGITLKLVAPGDAGALVSQLVLTRDNPMGDVVYGIDNTFATRALDAGVIAPYTSPNAGPEQAQYRLGKGELTAVDFSDVCVNVDHEWFAAEGLAEPTTLDDLTQPEYRDLLVVENPATSSPGLAFVMATIAEYGENGWRDYWSKLSTNGVLVAPGWTEAYYTEFSGAEGQGPRPLVVSYASSPPVTVREGDTTAPTGALLDTCFRQVEYAGVIAGTSQPQAAQQVVDFFLSAHFQRELPEQMYVYPISPDTPLPPEWEANAPLSPEPHTLDPAAIDANREQWIEQWTETVVG